MDDALVPWQNRLRVREFMIVLILVLMDDALVLTVPSYIVNNRNQS